jgi:hypothetical protein
MAAANVAFIEAIGRPVAVPIAFIEAIGRPVAVAIAFIARMGAFLARMRGLPIAIGWV